MCILTLAAVQKKSLVRRNPVQEISPEKTVIPALMMPMLAALQTIDLTVNGDTQKIPESAVASKAGADKRQISIKDTGSRKIRVLWHLPDKQ